jgi:hypothetical protein
MGAIPLEMLTLERFTELLNHRFQVQVAPGHGIAMELAQATAGRSSVSAGANPERYEAFSLIFNGPESPQLPQGIYAFEQEKIGRFELFIVPVGREGGAVQYQAVFNRPVNSGSHSKVS